MKIKAQKSKGLIMTKKDKKAAKEFRNNRKNKHSNWVAND